MHQSATILIPQKSKSTRVTQMSNSFFTVQFSTRKHRVPVFLSMLFYHTNLNIVANHVRSLCGNGNTTASTSRTICVATQQKLLRRRLRYITRMRPKFGPRLHSPDTNLIGHLQPNPPNPYPQATGPKGPLPPLQSQASQDSLKDTYRSRSEQFWQQHNIR